MSEEAALCQEQAHLQEALLRSKSCGGPPISGDDIVIFRLSRFSKDVQEILTTSSQLGPCHHQVTDAGCQVRPDFTDATCLVPITAEQYAELDLHLEVHRILACRKDRDLIMKALRQVSSRQRPKLRNEDHAYLTQAPKDHPPVDSAEESDRAELHITEECVLNGFVHFKLPCDVSEIASDKACHSAPAGTSDTANAQPRNVHRFRFCNIKRLDVCFFFFSKQLKSEAR